MKKILVIGSSGAGKSTFARQLGQILNLEVIHLDAYYWKSGWIETPRGEWQNIVEELLNRESWIIDGNYSNTLELRLAKCDTVIFLDIARRVCLWRVLKRAFTYRGRRRPDMAEGCPEKMDMEFFLWVWGYPKRTRPKVIEMLERNAQHKKAICLRSATEVQEFLSAIEKSTGATV